MDTQSPKRTHRVLGTLLLGMALALGTVASSPFQTWLAQQLLNKWATTEEMVWRVEEAKMGLAPLELELHQIELTHAEGEPLTIELVRARAGRMGELFRNGRLDSVHIQGIHGTIPAFPPHSKRTDEAGETGRAVIDFIQLEDVVLDWKGDTTPLKIACSRVTGTHWVWDKGQLRGALDASHAAVTPLRDANGQRWSLPWAEATEIDHLHLVSTVDSTKTGWAVEIASNWGTASGQWGAGQAGQALQFEWHPTPSDWPVDRGQPWFESLQRALTEETVGGLIRWNNDSLIAGQLEGLGLELPLVVEESDWSVGPFDVHSAVMEVLASASGFDIPPFVSSSSIWRATIAHEADQFQLSLISSDNPNKSIEARWNGDLANAQFDASVKGIGFRGEDAQVITGQWTLSAKGEHLADGWSGTFQAKHPEGDAIQSVWEAQIGDSSWTFDTQSHLIGLSRTPHDSPNWTLHGQLNWRASGAGTSTWTQIAELRNIVLLEDGVPRSFQRFDAVQTRQDDQWTLRWDSDVTNGTLQCNDALLEDWRLNFTSLSLEPRAADVSSVPYFTGTASVLRWAPIALLADLPVRISTPLSLEAKWEGRKGSFGLEIQDVTWSGIQASTIHMHALLGQVERPGIQWHAERLRLDGELEANDLAGGLRPGPEGLAGTLQPFSATWKGQNLALKEQLDFTIHASSGALQAKDFTLLTPYGAIACSGGMEDTRDWHVHAQWFNDTLDASLLQAPISASRIAGVATIASQGNSPQLNAQFEIGAVSWEDHRVDAMEISATGPLFAPQVKAFATVDSLGSIALASNLNLVKFDSSRTQLVVESIPLQAFNTFFPPSSIALDGWASGQVAATGLNRDMELRGRVQVRDGVLGIPYLGTEYRVDGTVEVLPDGFYLDQWSLTDRNGNAGSFNGTALHTSFGDWSLDFGVELRDDPLELMNIPATQDALFYGQAFGTGDINVSGYGPYLQLDANVSTGLGTDFALPMDGSSDVNYAEFIRFKSPTNEASYQPTARGVFSDVTLNLGIDVEDGAQARIVFDRDVGDEIIGEAVGHLDLTVDDFEQLRMTGNLEITEGAYHFTLQNWLNKRFDIQPGSTIAWQGDPYDAELAIATTYTTRTNLDALLPETPDLPGRVPVELGLQLDGSMLRPNLDFGIEVPSADSRIQALVEGALISEEEVQRQALSLLVMGQFLPSNPAEASVGGFIQPAQSTQFLANQLGHWISQIAPAMDVGLDYAQDPLSGEQALGLALSTQVWNDRLHIEGELGAQALGQVHAEDVQIQDLTVSFDLTPSGNIQLTGQSRQNANLSTTIEGQSVQGVGIRFKWAFDHWRELGAE